VHEPSPASEKLPAAQADTSAVQEQARPAAQGVQFAAPLADQEPGAHTRELAASPGKATICSSSSSSGKSRRRDRGAERPAGGAPLSAGISGKRRPAATAAFTGASASRAIVRQRFLFLFFSKVFLFFFFYR